MGYQTKNLGELLAHLRSCAREELRKAVIEYEAHIRATPQAPQYK